MLAQEDNNQECTSKQMVTICNNHHLQNLNHQYTNLQTHTRAISTLGTSHMQA